MYHLKGWITNNDEMMYEMNHILNSRMKSNEAMILAVMNAILTIA